MRNLYPAATIFHSPHRSAQAGFTLLELLIVIAIIAILAALISTSFQKMKAQAARANCAANLRQIGIGFASYSFENKGKFPPHWGPDDNGQALAWYGFVAPYIIDFRGPEEPMSKIFHCPANFRPFNQSQDYLSTAANVDQSYGYNYLYLTSNPSYQNSSRKLAIPHGTKFVLAADIPSFGDPNDIVAFPSSPPGLRLYPAATNDYQALRGVSRRHAGSANYLFLDGHVESRKSQSFAHDNFDSSNWIPGSN